MTLDDVGELVRKLRAENRTVLALLGGEPTEHPQFAEILAVARRADLKIRVFSNGDIPQRSLAALARLPESDCHVVVNANACGLTHSDIPEHVDRLLWRLQARASLGITVTAHPFNPADLLGHYERFQLRPQLRLSLAHPKPGDPSRPVADYRDPALAASVVELALQARQQGLALDYDCGFVACMFDSEQRRALDARGAFPHCVCNPIPDIAPANRAWPCFPLSARFAMRTYAGQSLAELKSTMSARLEVFASVGIYPECQTCSHKAERTCRGGCVARIVNSFERLAS